MKEAPSKFEEENNCKNINVGGRQLNNTFPNQKQEENNIYNDIHDDNTNPFNYNIQFRAFLMAQW